MTVRKRGSNYFSRFELEGKQYYFNFNGKKGQPLITKRTEAEIKEADLKKEILTGTFITDSDLKNFTKFFDDIYMDYSSSNKTPEAQEYDKYCGKHLKAVFGERGLRDITAPMVERFINDLLNTKTKYNKTFNPVTVRRIYNLLNQIFRMALRHRLLHENPCQYVSRTVLEKIPAWRPRDRWLNKYEAIEVEDKDGNKKLMTEEERLFEAFVTEGKHLAPMSRLMLNTGLRPLEVLAVKKEHVNLTDKSRWYKVDGIDQLLPPSSLLVERGKGGRPRVVPLNKIARKVLEVLLNDVTTGVWIFTNDKGEPMKAIKKGFHAACVRAGLSDLRSKDLRRTFATRLVERGVHEYIISNLLGHTTQSSGFGAGSRITPGYAHATWDAKVKAVLSLEDFTPVLSRFELKQKEKVQKKEKVRKIGGSHKSRTKAKNMGAIG